MVGGVLPGVHRSRLASDKATRAMKPNVEPREALQSRLVGQVLRTVRWQCAVFYLGTLDIEDLC